MSNMDVFNVEFQGRPGRIVGHGCALIPPGAIQVDDPEHTPVGIITLIYQCQPECADPHHSDPLWYDLNLGASIVAQMLELAREGGYFDALMAKVDQAVPTLREARKRLGD